MKILKLTLFLAIVAGLSGAALSFVFDMTDPIIQEQKIASERENLVKIYASAEFVAVEDTDTSKYPSIQGIYEAKGLGYVYKCSVKGYGGPVVYLVALDNDGTYKGFEVIDCSNETKGFGSKVAEQPFKDSVVGKNIGDPVDTITGATVTSGPVVAGIEEASAHYEENFK
ncbi:MAG: FMN-binding protein [Erysipelotrichales bacterium]|nr:FMN-binding protein [Erysipelotrichales bacterium]